MTSLKHLQSRIRRCKLCPDLPDFSFPLFQGNENAKIMLISQAPSKTVMFTRRKWDDDFSGRILKSWFDVPEETFYNENVFYLTALGKCYPGRGKRADKPPNPACAKKWLFQEIELVRPRLIITIGQKAFKWFFPNILYDQGLDGAIRYWRGTYRVFSLPHPSPANVAWRTKNKLRLEKIIRNLRREVKKIIVEE